MTTPIISLKDYRSIEKKEVVIVEEVSDNKERGTHLNPFSALSSLSAVDDDSDGLNPSPSPCSSELSALTDEDEKFIYLERKVA